MIELGAFDANARAYFRHMCQVAEMSLSGSEPSKLRVTIVRNPYDVLRCWYSELPLAAGKVERTIGFNEYVRDYLHFDAGRIGESHNDFAADTVMRIEDMPWAFIEFAESLGVASSVLDKLRDEKPEPVPSHNWDPGLRRQVLDAERDFCERYNYF